MLKRCSKCGVEKDILYFYRDRTCKDGHQSKCKKCSMEVVRAFQQTPNGKRTKARADAKYHQTQKGEIALARRGKKYSQTQKGKTSMAKRHKTYYQTRRGKMAIKRATHRRRAHMKSTEASLASEQWDAVISMQGNKCNICKQKFTKRRLPTIDHIIPLSKGGGLTFENAQALCRSCNSSKNAKLDLGFIQTWSHSQ